MGKEVLIVSVVALFRDHNYRCMFLHCVYVNTFLPVSACSDKSDATDFLTLMEQSESLGFLTLSIAQNSK
jgi:hypothetical protein